MHAPASAPADHSSAPPWVRHRGLRQWVADLNHAHRGEPALHALDFDPAGWEWIDANDSVNSTLSFLRKAPGGDLIACAFNFTPVPRSDYQLGVPRGGFWQELLNSDAAEYGGTGWGNLGGVEARAEAWHGRPWSLTIGLPPLGAVFFKSAASD